SGDQAWIASQEYQLRTAADGDERIQVSFTDEVAGIDVDLLSNLRDLGQFDVEPEVSGQRRVVLDPPHKQVERCLFLVTCVHVWDAGEQRSQRASAGAPVCDAEDQRFFVEDLFGVAPRTEAATG